jgi:hypothetical protein
MRIRIAFYAVLLAIAAGCGGPTPEAQTEAPVSADSGLKAKSAPIPGRTSSRSEGAE